MAQIVLVLLALSLAISVVASGLLRRWAPRWGLVDHPSQRKSHDHAIPLGGGLAIYLGTVVPVALAYLVVLVIRSSPPPWLPVTVTQYLDGVVQKGPQLGMIGVAATVIMLVGLLDDRRNLNFALRLFVQIAMAMVVLLMGVRISGFLHDPLVTGALTVLWIVGLTNAFNFLDNMDGLSAGVATIAATLLLVLQLLLGHYFVAALLLVVVGSLLGFLVHNWPPARLYMGDAGSNYVGFLLGVSTVLATFAEADDPTYMILAPLCVMAVPIYDSASVILIRLLEGRNPFQADRRHFSHRLVELGMSNTGAVLTIYLVTLTSGLGALLLYYEVGVAGVVVILAQVVAVLAIIAILETSGRQNDGGRKGTGHGETPQAADTPSE